MGSWPGRKAVRIGKCEQQRLDVEPRRASPPADRARPGARWMFALAREHVDEVRVVPRSRRHRRIRQVAVDENARRALQAAVNERYHSAAGRPSEMPLVRLADEQVLVRRRTSSLRERQRRLRRLERFAAQRMRGAHEVLVRAAATSVVAAFQYFSASPAACESLIATRLVAARRVAGHAGGLGPGRGGATSSSHAPTPAGSRADWRV